AEPVSPVHPVRDSSRLPLRKSPTSPPRSLRVLPLPSTGGHRQVVGLAMLADRDGSSNDRTSLLWHRDALPHAASGCRRRRPSIALGTSVSESTLRSARRLRRTRRRRGPSSLGMEYAVRRQ